MNEQIKVTVLDEQPVERSGEFDGRDGEKISYTTRKQKARLEAGGFAYPFDVRLDDGQRPYPKGDYALDVGAMLAVNKGVATLSKFTALRPLAAAK